MGMPENSAYRSSAISSSFRLSPSAKNRNEISSDDSSDYGLDFTPEEEELLSDILSETPNFDSPTPAAADTDTATASTTAILPTSSPVSISISSPESFFSAQSALSLIDDDELVSILQTSEALAEQVSGSASKALPTAAYGDSAFTFILPFHVLPAPPQNLLS